MEKINIINKLNLFQDHWNPRIIGELNGQHVKLAKLKGEFIWHSHEKEDELFYVIKGCLKMEFRDRVEILQPGEMIIVPRGVDHKPVAVEEVHIMLFEPASTINTGDIENERTRKKLGVI
jgi:mannose-6-phosphate isomerase-like protein (cupin superfamily)